jgi:hypothetical protein
MRHGGEPLGDVSPIVRVAFAIYENVSVRASPLASPFEDGVGVERDGSRDGLVVRAGSLVPAEDDRPRRRLEFADFRLNQLMRSASSVVVHGDHVPHEGVSVSEQRLGFAVYGKVGFEQRPGSSRMPSTLAKGLKPGGSHPAFTPRRNIVRTVVGCFLTYKR